MKAQMMSSWFFKLREKPTSRRKMHYSVSKWTCWASPFPYTACRPQDQPCSCWSHITRRWNSPADPRPPRERLHTQEAPYWNALCREKVSSSHLGHRKKKRVEFHSGAKKWLKKEIAWWAGMTQFIVTCCDQACMPRSCPPLSWKSVRWTLQACSRLLPTRSD